MKKFDTTGEAYDACQCDDSIKDGDTLIIDSERVIGLAWTWPVAVTVEHGSLHHPAADGNLERLMAEAHWEREQVRRAVLIAISRNWEVHPFFRPLVD